MRLKKVEIVWLDAVIEEGHIHHSAIDAMVPIERHTIGYVVAEDDECVKITYGTLENFYKGERAYDMVLVIPRGMIKKITTIEEAP